MGRKACQRWLSLALLSVFMFSSAIGQKGDDGAIKEFQDRMDNYLSAKKKQDIAKKPTDSPGKLAEEKQQTVEKTQAARPEAQQGDIFTPPVAAYFKKQIEGILRGPNGDRVRASLRHAEPLPNVQLQVNAKVSPEPAAAIHAANAVEEPTPASQRASVQDRGVTLVLYDMASGLVVDFIPGAVPAL